jgi:hypothetical protein
LVRRERNRIELFWRINPFVLFALYPRSISILFRTTSIIISKMSTAFGTIFTLHIT